VILLLAVSNPNSDANRILISPALGGGVRFAGITIEQLEGWPYRDARSSGMPFLADLG
jgi:hypothetical protein